MSSSPPSLVAPLLIPPPYPLSPHPSSSSPSLLTPLLTPPSPPSLVTLLLTPLLTPPPHPFSPHPSPHPSSSSPSLLTPLLTPPPHPPLFSSLPLTSLSPHPPPHPSSSPRSAASFVIFNCLNQNFVGEQNSIFLPIILHVLSILDYNELIYHF